MVVYGQDKLDEISVSANTTVCEIKDGKLFDYELVPEDFGIKRCKKEDLVGGDSKVNAQITLDILNGEKGPSAAGLYVAGKVSSLEEGVELACEIIDSGKAKEQLDNFIKYTNL